MLITSFGLLGSLFSLKKHDCCGAICIAFFSQAPSDMGWLTRLLVSAFDVKWKGIGRRGRNCYEECLSDSLISGYLITLYFIHLHSTLVIADLVW